VPIDEICDLTDLSYEEVLGLMENEKWIGGLIYA
jgi:hypothetical protein